MQKIEENIRMGKTTDLFKTEIPRIFHAKIGIIKDRNSNQSREAEDIEKRWQEYTEELHKKVLNDLDNHNDMITNIESEILEYEVKGI